MRQLLSTLGGPELGLLKSRLEDAGIACEVRDEQMSQTIHSAAFPAELWIVKEEDYPQAVALWSAWNTSPSAPPEAWTCPACGERLESPFTECWKCGAQREPSPEG